MKQFLSKPGWISRFDSYPDPDKKRNVHDSLWMRLLNNEWLVDSDRYARLESTTDQCMYKCKIRFEIAPITTAV